MNDEFQISVNISFRDALRRFQKNAQQKNEGSGTTFSTFSGLKIDLLNFSSADVRMGDIAHGLSNMCRFGGQCRRFYSVAEHSILVSKFVEYGAMIAVPGMELAALFHDASEAYLGDMTTPLKRMCPGYQIIEKSFERSIHEALGVAAGFNDPMIKECDFRMYLRERDVLMPGGDDSKVSDELDELLKIRFLSPLEAEEAFLGRARDLGVNLAS